MKSVKKKTTKGPKSGLMGVKAVDFVFRQLSTVPVTMRLMVTEVTDKRIVCCGGWKFDKATGAGNRRSPWMEP